MMKKLKRKQRKEGEREKETTGGWMEVGQEERRRGRHAEMRSQTGKEDDVRLPPPNPPPHPCI